MATKPDVWRNRIVGHADVDPSELVAHDLNWRSHAEAQRAAVGDSIGELGFIRSVTVSEKSGRILDGHLRVLLAIEKGQPTVPVEYVDLTEAEEAKALAYLDATAGMAGTDAGRLRELLDEVQTPSGALAQMLTDLAAGAGIVPEGDGETELRELDAKPPPAKTWVLLGIDTVRWGEIAELVEKLAAVPGAICETTVNSGE